MVSVGSYLTVSSMRSRNRSETLDTQRTGLLGYHIQVVYRTGWNKMTCLIAGPAVPAGDANQVRVPRPAAAPDHAAVAAQPPLHLASHRQPGGQQLPASR